MRAMMTGVANKFKGGVALFSPNSIAGLQLWIDGDTGVVDLSDNAYSLTNSGTTILSSNLNSHDVFDFDGSSQIECASSASVDITAALTAYVVVKVDGSGVQFYFHKGENELANANQYFLQYSPDSDFARIGNGSSNFSASTPSGIDQNSWRVIKMEFIPSTSLTIYEDGVQVAQNTTSIPATMTSRTDPLTIGAHSRNQIQELDGQIAFLAIYDENLSVGDDSDLMDYINSRYAL